MVPSAVTYTYLRQTENETFLDGRKTVGDVCVCVCVCVCARV